MMKQDILDFVVEKTHELMNAEHCCEEAKAAAKAWLDAIGTEQEAAKTRNYVKELEEDIIPIDGLIGFAESDDGVRIFGADGAKNLAAHGKEIKSAGAKYCDCSACAAAEAILEKKDALLN